MKKKLISIIINCYNGEKFLKKNLKSVLKQDYKNFEVIFIDNCSTDRSAKIFKEINDKRFKYFKTKKKVKLYEGRNFALKKCNGQFITFLDTDDWWKKNFLSSRNKFYNSTKEYGFCYSNCFHYYENKNKFEPFSKKNLPSGFVLDDLLKYYFVKMGTIIIKRKLISYLRFNPDYNIIGDYDFIIKASQKFKGMAFQDYLVNIRIHHNNFTQNNRNMFYKEFEKWYQSQNFNNVYFQKNRSFLKEKLEYLRIIDLLFRNKRFNLIYDIIKMRNFNNKLRLLFIYLMPIFIINFKLKYL